MIRKDVQQSPKYTPPRAVAIQQPDLFEVSPKCLALKIHQISSNLTT